MVGETYLRGGKISEQSPFPPSGVFHNYHASFAEVTTKNLAPVRDTCGLRIIRKHEVCVFAIAALKIIFAVAALKILH